MGTDYEALLKKYMRHVYRCEGTTYTSDLYLDGWPSDFTPEEKEILLRIADEACEEPDDEEVE